MSESDGALTDFPEMDTADLPEGVEHDAQPEPIEPPAEPLDAAGDDEPAAAADPADPSAELPAYRREAIANRELRGEVAELKRLILEGRQPAQPTAVVPGQGEELTPEQKSVQDKFFKVFPKAKDLFEKADAIIRASEVAPSLASQAEQADNFRADSALKSAVDSVAAKTMGPGKTGANLRPEFRGRVVRAFAQWAGADYANEPEKMPADVRARAIRYQNGDTGLAAEFAKDFLSDFTPVDRPARVADAKRAGVPSPRGGPSSAPPPAGPKPPDPNDEDSVHNAAFKDFRAQVAAGG